MNKVAEVVPEQPRSGALRIMIIGSLPPPVGGTAISFDHLRNQLLNDERVQVSLVNTAGIRGRGLRGALRFLITVGKILVWAFRVDVISLHQVPTGLVFLGPIVLAASRLARRPFVVRIFAGQDYMDLPRLQRIVVDAVVRHSDLYLAQTQSLVEKAKERGIRNVEWYPTSRPLPPRDAVADRTKGPCLKFVFVGHVNRVKGITEIIAIDGMLPPGVTIDVYGPFTGGISLDDFKECLHVRYRGPLSSDTVVQTLGQYDALLLPTYHDGEGYPGVIIEAYAAGLPVICTRWMSLPELVDEACGILIPPRNSNALLEAVQKMSGDERYYADLCKGAMQRRQEFSAERWANQFILRCAALAKTTLPPAIGQGD